MAANDTATAETVVTDGRVGGSHYVVRPVVVRSLERKELRLARQPSSNAVSGVEVGNWLFPGRRVTLVESVESLSSLRLPQVLDDIDVEEVLAGTPLY